MPAYAILRQSRDLGDGTRIFRVILRANDGYQETHEIRGDVTTLREATRHFHNARVASLVVDPPDPTPPVFVNVALT